MTSLTVLDLFCGGGGAAEGYRRAGYRVIGVDNADHERSFARVGEFHRMDWEAGLEKFADEADVIHASPPCQRYSALTKWGRKANLASHPDLVPPVREALNATGKPWVIENVEGAPLHNAILLCAWTFRYEHYRHRLFEAGCGLTLSSPAHQRHPVRSSSPGHFHEHAHEGWFISIGGHFAPADLAREVMDTDWMTGPELAEAIPPYYTHYIASQVAMHLLLRPRTPGPVALKRIWERQPAPPIHLGDGTT